MIDINFLPPPRLDGMEYLDFQDDSFFKEMSELYDEQLKTTGYIYATPRAKEIITRHTGFENIEIVPNESGEASVDSGFFNSEHILNNAGIEKYLKYQQSTLYKAMKENTIEEELMEGWVCSKTGMVHGIFKHVKVTINIGSNYEKMLDFKVPEAITEGEAITAILFHELAHVWSACYFASSSIKDNIQSRIISNIHASEPDPKVKQTVYEKLNGVFVLGMSKDEVKALAESEDNQEAVTTLILSKQNAHNLKRSLSLGSTRMQSEVLADAFAVRMGAGVALGHVSKDIMKLELGASEFVIPLLMTYDAILSVALTNTTVPAIAKALKFDVFMITMLLVVNLVAYNKNGEYNTARRRPTDITRELLNKLKTSKVTPREKQQIIALVEELHKSPFYASLSDTKSILPMETLAKRGIMMLFTGGDFAKSEFEHYTKELQQHKIGILEHKFENLKARTY